VTQVSMIVRSVTVLCVGYMLRLKQASFECFSTNTHDYPVAAEFNTFGIGLGFL